MYYGELKEKSKDYVDGHITGGERLATNIKAELKILFSKTKSKKVSKLEVMKIVQKNLDMWYDHNLDYGLAKKSLDDLAKEFADEDE